MYSVLTEKTGGWFKCKYQIVEVPTGLNDGSQVKLIAPVQGSIIEYYYPLKYEKNYRLQNEPNNRRYQPSTDAGKEWPPHLALMRLNLNDEDEVSNFCCNYGLLGLRRILAWKTKEPTHAKSKLNYNATDYSKASLNSHSGWYIYPSGKIQDQPFYKKCEPLEIFIEAAQEFQEIMQWLLSLDNKIDSNEDNSGTYVLNMKLLGLDGCNPQPVYQNGEWIFGWDIQSLLEACYLRVILDLTEGAWGYRKCKRNQCKKIFLAYNRNDYYCCSKCRKTNTSYTSPPRVLKREVMLLRKKGRITAQQRKEIYCYIDSTWKDNKRLIGWTKDVLPLKKFRDKVRKFINELLKTK